jgi:hypothetical protein
MPTQRIKWKPNTAPNIVAYEIFKSDTGVTGPYTLLIQVLHMIPSTAWSNTEQCFFYDDPVQPLIPYRYYRIATLDRYGNRAEDDAPTPFHAGNNPIDTPELHTLALTADTGGPNNLQYISQGGTPIKDARIRVYKKIDWDTRNFANVVGTTLTLGDGTWKDPVFVQPGETYTVVYSKVNEFGPNTAEVTG